MEGNRGPKSQPQTQPSTPMRGWLTSFLELPHYSPVRRLPALQPWSRGDVKFTRPQLLSVLSRRCRKVRTFPLATAADTALMPVLSSRAGAWSIRGG